MTLNTQPTEQLDPLTHPTENPDWRELRHQEREERRADRQEWRENNSWIGGAVLIGLGLIFLLQNFGFFYLQNWWALFILIPAFGAFGTAWALYRSNDHRFPIAATGSLVTGTILTLLSLTFLLGWNFSLIWPFFLVLGGLSILVSTMKR
ncbi:MAG: hypothetical protein KF893_00840 [Caldilineaceae bacterium]|nr:hypothetical protein [Caldilineaceae bacterium]